MILDTKKSRTIEFESNMVISMICVSLNNDVIAILLVKMKEGKNNNFDFNINDMKFETRGVDCSRCPNNCEIVKVYKNNVLIDSWGNRCENGLK